MTDPELDNPIKKSDREILAPWGRSDVYYEGELVKIRVTGVSSNEYVSLAVREALVGLEILTFFTAEQISEQDVTKPNFPKGLRFTYIAEVCADLIEAGKKQAAEELNKAGRFGDMYAFEPEISEVID